GEIRFNGKQINMHTINPHQAQVLGISIIHQESELVPHLTVAENILLGQEPINSFRLIDTDKIYKRAKEVLGRVKSKVSPKILVKNLSASQQRLVEIARAITLNPKLIIMDEPTTVLTEQEVKDLFDIIHLLQKQKITVIYISHRIEEIFGVANRVTVLRDGKLTASLRVDEVTEDSLVQLMVGRELKRSFPIRKTKIGGEILSGVEINKKGVLKEINFCVHEGEILGVTGLVGCGRSELAKVIFGASRIDSGEFYLNKKRVVINSPSDAIRNGIGLIPEDRKGEGLILKRSVKENISLASLDRISKYSFINSSAEIKKTKKFRKTLQIKTPSINQLVLYLSGGNQQKVVFARWLLTYAKVLIFNEPTVGIDVGTKQEIYYLINQIAERGRSIIMISSELPEILGMSDRILVMRDGEIAKEFSRDEATQEKILYYSAGLEEE
ncbi:MAG: sugar ABC transporter ATP-binding protein, partial [Candidatus Aerophobetes bacterium]|nr:sugar ABC transporter ATP-binding protein [Candidatus Aerophobetes bacterium]